MLTQTQLRLIQSDTESHHAERTTSSNNMDKFCQAICVLHNDVTGNVKNEYLIIEQNYDENVP
jgi:ATP-dependent DNA helicase RecG